MAERASLFVSNPVGADGPITAEDGRLGLAAGYVGSGLVTARSGFRPAAAAPGLVTATSPTPNGFVHVAPFQRTHQSLRYAGVYIQTLDVTKDIDVLGPNPADATNIRHDLVIIHQQDVAASEADSLMRIRYVVGTPAASPSDPSLAAYPEFRKLARVRVAAGATTITSAMIDDLRADGDNILHTVASGGILPIASTTQRSAIISPYEGMPIYRTDRDWVEIYDGGAWRAQGVAVCTSTADRDSAITSPYSGQHSQTTNSGDILWQYDGGTSSWVQIGGAWMPRGWIGEAATDASAGDITAKVVIDSVLNKTISAGRRIKLTWTCAYDRAATAYPTLGLGYQSGSTITAAGLTALPFDRTIDTSTLSRPYAQTSTIVIPSTGTWSFGSHGASNGADPLHVYKRVLIVEDIGGS